MNARVDRMGKLEHALARLSRALASLRPPTQPRTYPPTHLTHTLTRLTKPTCSSESPDSPHLTDPSQVYVEVAELRKRVSKMRLHADKGQGTPRGRAIAAAAEAEERGQDESVRAALERALQQLQLKDRR